MIFPFILRYPKFHPPACQSYMGDSTTVLLIPMARRENVNTTYIQRRGDLHFKVVSMKLLGLWRHLRKTNYTAREI